MRRVHSLELIAKNKGTERLPFRSLNDLHRFRLSSCIVSARRTKSEQPLPCFNYKVKLKLLAVDMAIKKLLNRIIFIEDIERNKLGKFVRMQCPEQIRSWMYEDWLETESNRVLWFNVVNRQMSPRQFTIWMKLKNFAAIRNCLYDLTDCYLHKNNYLTPMDIMTSVSNFHNLEAKMSKQAQQNMKTTGKARAELIALNFIRRSIGSIFKKPDDLFVISITENSYVMRFNKAREQQAEMRIQMAEDRLQKEINRIKKRTREEQFASTCTKDTYFNQIANMRERIAKLTQHYDSEYTRLDGNITYLKSAIEKIQVNRAYLEEEIAWFKEDVQLTIAGINPPIRYSMAKPVIKHIQFHKERKFPLLRSQKSLVSINSQTKRDMRPRTRRKKHSSPSTGSENPE